MRKVCPTDNVEPTETKRLLLVITYLLLPAPVRTNRSYPVPGLVPLMSILKLEAGSSVSACRVITAVLFPPFPGARFPPAETVRRSRASSKLPRLINALVESPPIVPLLLTVTFPVPKSPLPFTRRVPPFTVVPFVKLTP